MLPEEEYLCAELKELNSYLRKRRHAGGSRRERRERALQQGVFTDLHHLSAAEIRSFFKERPLAGVDGSFISYGASYPYLIVFFRALARTTAPGDGNRIWKEGVFSPLLPRFQERLSDKLEQRMAPEAAIAHLRWEMLAELEAEVSEDALKREKPRLLLLDGGFARLEEHAPEIWERVRDAALAEGTVVLGVTEEIATCSLAQTLLGGSGFPGDFADREVLFGLLEPGEVYQQKGGLSRDKGRVYVRFARHPQVVAVDYLLEQQQELLRALNFLSTITPQYGRGFPLWLDVVDAEVRLTREQVEALLATYLDPALTEVFLRPLRESREL